MKNLLNKGLLVKVMCGVLVVTMVGCYSKGAEEQEQQEQQVQVEEPVGPVRTDDYEEPEETEDSEEYVAEDPVIKDEYIAPEEQDVPNITKEEAAESIKYTIQDSMGYNYTVEVDWYDDNTCNIGIMDNNYAYSYLGTDELAELCELYGLTDAGTGLAQNAEQAFLEAGHNINVNIIFFDCNMTAFMMIDSTGYAIYY